MKEYNPIILSASRATDIPAFFGEWFAGRLKKGYFIKRNPFNGEDYKIYCSDVRVIVFWTKNPAPFFKHLKTINKIVPQFYFQYTLNDYDPIIEQNLPNFENRLSDFKSLSDLIGRDKVIWRFDPLLLHKDLKIERLTERILSIAELLDGYTQKLVFSFIDIRKYKKVSNKISKNNLSIRELRLEEKNYFAQHISSIQSQYGMQVSSCAEEIDFTEYAIHHNKCIDDELLRQLFPEDQSLLEFLSIPKMLKDKGQRKFCNCIKSKDIGMYNTCIHSCVYCYAVRSNKTALKNLKHTNATIY
jgi:DNA repair photolyase